MNRWHFDNCGKDDNNKALSDKVKTTETIECPHCKKVGKLAGMKRWHLDNCKHKIENL
jgi:hypothetical protein